MASIVPVSSEASTDTVTSDEIEQLLEKGTPDIIAVILACSREIILSFQKEGLSCALRIIEDDVEDENGVSGIKLTPDVITEWPDVKLAARGSKTIPVIIDCGDGTPCIRTYPHP
jgi:hypothetical protein